MEKAIRSTFLFIHGAGGSFSKWRGQKGLEHSAKFIDLPGHGENKEDLRTTIEGYADWVAERIEEDVIVVGHSMGGLIGIELASNHDKVKGLVLAGSHYRLPVNPMVLEELAKGSFPEKFFYASYSRQTPKELIDEEKEELKINPVSVRKNDLEACDRYIKGEEAVQSLNKPILAVYGTEDRLIPKDAEEKLTSLNSKIQTVVIPDAGHYVMLEQPEKFNKAIVKFKDKL